MSNDWVRMNRHLQRVGTATCDASNLILLAYDAKSEGHDRWAFALMSAARDVTSHRLRASESYGRKLAAKAMPSDRWGAA